jgi:hypothetical protein
MVRVLLGVASLVSLCGWLLKIERVIISIINSFCEALDSTKPLQSLFVSWYVRSLMTKTLATLGCDEFCILLDSLDLNDAGIDADAGCGRLDSSFMLLGLDILNTTYKLNITPQMEFATYHSL